MNALDPLAWVVEDTNVIYRFSSRCETNGNDVEVKVIRKGPKHVVILGVAPNGERIRKIVSGKAISRLRKIGDPEVVIFNGAVPYENKEAQ